MSTACTLHAKWHAYTPRHIPSDIKHWPDVTQAAFRASIMQLSASEHLTLVVPPPSLGRIPVLSRLEADVGEPPLYAHHQVLAR